MYFLQSIFQVSFLGLVQGLTEFLPVSSSGHLVIIQHFLPLVNQQPVVLDLMLHLGSLLALLVYFFSKIKNIFIDKKLISSIISSKARKKVLSEARVLISRETRKKVLSEARVLISSKARKKVLSEARVLISRETRKKVLSEARVLILATIITVVIVFPFRKIVETSFSNLRFAGIMLIGTGIVLFLASRKKGNNKDKVGFKEAIMVGLGQALAVFPGISRSGLTISAGIGSGLKSNVATEFSFLLAIPLITGAAVLEIPKIISVSSGLLLIYFIGFLVSFFVSLFSLKLLMKILKLNQKNLVYFAYYCFLVGLTVILGV